MSRMHTWSSSLNGISHDFKREVPTDIDELDLIVGLFGSTDQLGWEAGTSATIAVEPGCRDRLEDIPAAEHYAATYVADGSKEVAYVKTTTQTELDEQDFDEDQMAFVLAKFGKQIVE